MISAKEASEPTVEPPAAVRDLPATRSLVWWTLREISPASLGAIQEASGLSRTAAQASVDDLCEVGAVRRAPARDDPRYTVFRYVE